MTPPGTRLILASENLLEQFGARTEDGRKITAEWGDPNTDGWYSPTFTVTDDGKRLVSEAELATALGTWWADSAARNSRPVVGINETTAARAIFAALVAAREKGA